MGPIDFSRSEVEEIRVAGNIDDDFVVGMVPRPFLADCSVLPTNDMLKDDPIP